MGYITVAQIIEMLQECDPNDIVIISDHEGSGYAPIDSIEKECYEEVYGYCHIRKLTPELKDQGYCKDDLAPENNSIPCIVIYPRG